MISLLRAIDDGIHKSDSPAISSEANDRPHILVLRKGVGLVSAHVQDPWNDEATEAKTTDHHQESGWLHRWRELVNFIHFPHFLVTPLWHN
jgi:hypothetical protein